MRKFLLLIAVVFCMVLRLAAQETCACGLLPPTAAVTLLRTADSADFYQKVNPLKSGTSLECQAWAYRYEVDYLISRKKLPAALSILDSLEKLLRRLNCTDAMRQEWLLAAANYSKAAQDYENLSNNAFQALELAETRKDEAGQFKAITYIVHLFTRQHQDEKNWPYVKRAEALVLALPDDEQLATRYNWLAFEYEKKYTLTQRQSLMDTAVGYARKAQPAALQQGDFAELARCYRVFESDAYSRGKYQLAIGYIDSAIHYLQQLKTPANPASLYFTKAWDYMDLKNYKEAERWQDTSIYYAEKYEGRTPATMSLYGEAARLFETTGNLTRSLELYKTYTKIKDSVFDQQRLEKINELEQKYTKAKDEKTIRELAQQRSIYLLAALAFLLAAVAIAFYLRQQRLRHKKNILETEQRLNRARMNPHFFFNSLTALQKYALQQKDVQAMAGSLSRFSAIMRETLESTYKEYVSIEHEMAFLQQYLEVQRMRLPNSFTFSVSAAPELEIDELQIPSMILQPFLENSIEHGFAGLDRAPLLQVQFSKEGSMLQILIRDNGKGLGQGLQEPNEHISRALQIIQDRLYLLNLKQKSKAGYQLLADPSGVGVQVVIRLPLLYTDTLNAAT